MENIGSNSPRAAAATATKPPSEIIKLNVGGTHFTSTRKTLCRVHNCFFSAMLSGRWGNNNYNEIFIDRSPLVFPIILDYLRGMEVEVDDLTKVEMKYLVSDADFYGLEELSLFLRDPRAELQPNFNCKLIRGHMQVSQNKIATIMPEVTSPVVAKWNNRVIADLPFPKPFKFEPYSEQTIRVLRGSQIMIGLASNSVLFDDALSYYKCGWYIFAGNGALYSELDPEANGTPYRRAQIEANSTVSVRLYHDGSISFAIDGVDYGRAYCNVVKGDVFLTVMMCGPEGSVELVST